MNQTNRISPTWRLLYWGSSGGSAHGDYELQRQWSGQWATGPRVPHYRAALMSLAVRRQWQISRLGRTDVDVDLELLPAVAKAGRAA